MQGRVVSRTALTYVDPVVSESEEAMRKAYKKSYMPRQTVAIQNQRAKYYFQYRIDELSKSTTKDPKICIGVCRDDFLVN